MIRIVLVLLVACGGRAMTASEPQPVVCSGGAKNIANQCYCPSGTTWNGLLCQGTPVAGTCGGGSYPFGPAGAEQCFCLDGYKLDGQQCIQLQCTGGSVAQVAQCVCPNGTQWDGAQCAAVAEQPAQQPDQQPAQVQCSGGAVAQGDQCVCPDGAQWDGQQCAAVAQAPQPHHRASCSAALINKGYAPSAAEYCKGANDRCAVALVDKGYGPDAMPYCKGVKGGCAEALVAKGYGPDAMPYCQNVDEQCALASIANGYGPDALASCKR
jgi:hypothetical protein